MELDGAGCGQVSRSPITVERGGSSGLISFGSLARFPITLAGGNVKVSCGRKLPLVSEYLCLFHTVLKDNDPIL